ncbi:hypothetical protein Hanom_Chr11g01062331 [Helianthus anomalus]
MVHWTQEKKIALVTSIVDTQHTLQRDQTAYWSRAFQQCQQNVGTRVYNLNACQHKWRELKQRLDRFKVCFDCVPAGDLTYDK